MSQKVQNNPLKKIKSYTESIQSWKAMTESVFSYLAFTPGSTVSRTLLEKKTRRVLVREHCDFFTHLLPLHPRRQQSEQAGQPASPGTACWYQKSNIDFCSLNTAAFAFWPVCWFPDGLAQRMTLFCSPGSDWSSLPGGSCCPLYKDILSVLCPLYKGGEQQQQTKKAIDKFKSPGRRRLRRKFLGGIRAQKGHSIFWGNAMHKHIQNWTHAQKKTGENCRLASGGGFLGFTQSGKD